MLFLPCIFELLITFFENSREEHSINVIGRTIEYDFYVCLI